MIQLTTMQAPAFEAYRLTSATGYAEDNVSSGRWPAQDALARSLAEFDSLLPQGLATPDHQVLDIRQGPDGAVVGVLWWAVVERHGLQSAFVYDVEVQAAHRRRGHARAAFRALEPLVRARGLSHIGLHVFGHNPGAQALYASLGYDVTGINMLKALAAG